MSLQPLKKSFPYYIQLGMEYVSKDLSEKQKKLLSSIKIDDSILIIDDILDNSKIRNNNSCLYVKKGIFNAIIYSELLKIKSIKKLINFAEMSGTSLKNIILIYEKLFCFLQDIYLGEKINLSSENTNLSYNVLIKNYLKMSKLFTGGHIKYGVEIGQLIMNKIPNKKISMICESAGIIRQIKDDYDDYFLKHHEPFGDFLSGNKRLPEILFYKFGGNRKHVLELIKKNKLNKARDNIFNENVKNELFLFYNLELNKIKKININFDYNLITLDLKF
jgi:geranylgeranyl pyrophosphate synthase